MVGERILYVLIMLMSENKGGNDDDDDYKHHNCSCNHQFYAAFVSRFVPSRFVRSLPDYYNSCSAIHVFFCTIAVSFMFI